MLLRFDNGVTLNGLKKWDDQHKDLHCQIEKQYDFVIVFFKFFSSIISWALRGGLKNRWRAKNFIVELNPEFDAILLGLWYLMTQYLLVKGQNVQCQCVDVEPQSNMFTLVIFPLMKYYSIDFWKFRRSLVYSTFNFSVKTFLAIFDNFSQDKLKGNYYFSRD